MSDDSLSDDLQLALNDRQDAAGQVQTIKEIMSPKNIDMKTEVNQKIGEASYFAKLSVLADVLDSAVLRNYVNKELRIRVSNDRKGRREAVEVSRSHPPSQQGSSIWQRMTGRG